MARAVLSRHASSSRAVEAGATAEFDARLTTFDLPMVNAEITCACDNSRLKERHFNYECRGADVVTAPCLDVSPSGPRRAQARSPVARSRHRLGPTPRPPTQVLSSNRTTCRAASQLRDLALRRRLLSLTETILVDEMPYVQPIPWALAKFTLPHPSPILSDKCHIFGNVITIIGGIALAQLDVTARLGMRLAEAVPAAWLYPGSFNGIDNVAAPWGPASSCRPWRRVHHGAYRCESLQDILVNHRVGRRCRGSASKDNRHEDRLSRTRRDGPCDGASSARCGA